MSDAPSRFSVGACHEFVITASKAGWTTEDMDMLTKSEKRCQEVLDVLHGVAEVKPIMPLVDFDGPVFTPSSETSGLPSWSTGGKFSWRVDEQDQIEARIRGRCLVAPKRLLLYVVEEQDRDESVPGFSLRGKLRGKLANRRVAGAQLLDFFLKNPRFLPEECKEYIKGDGAIVFWGTIYRNRENKQCVRCLYWDGAQWNWAERTLDQRFGPKHYALLGTDESIFPQP